MQVAILGATGCVGSNLVNKLVKSNEHEIIASYRSDKKVESGLRDAQIEWRKVDLKNPAGAQEFLKGADVLVYLIHSLESSKYESIDLKLADQVANAAQVMGIRKIIYLSAIAPKGQRLSHHLKSRVDTGIVLAAHGINVGEIRASILLGSCSVSYRIVYLLAKRLPLLITPRCLNSLCTPIALEDAVDAIESLIPRSVEGHEIFEIGSDVLRYRDLVSLCGEVMRGHRNIIITLHFNAISLSALWISLTTGVSYNLARALAESLMYDTVYTHNRFKEITGRDPIPVVKALRECLKDMKREH